MEEGERVLAPLRAVGEPIADVIGPHPFAGWQQAFDPLLTPGARNYWKSHDFHELSDGLVDTLLDFVGKLPDPQCEVFIAQLGGAQGRVPEASTAYRGRSAKFLMNAHGRWADADGDAKGTQWCRELFDATARFATGEAYVNFMSADESGRVSTAYGPSYERLVALKDRWDPSNLFRMNQNVPPSQG